MKCEIVNPSDCCFISGENLEALNLACALLGGGQYALKDEAGKSVAPMLMFVDGNEWWKKEFGRGINEALEALNDEVVKVLESFEYAGKRSSMNNIGARAVSIAKNLREKSKQPFEKPPQQVFSV